MRVSRRKLILVTGFVCTLGIAMFSGVKVISALERTTYTATYSLKAGGLNRSYKVIGPVAALPKSSPIIVVVGGIAAPVDAEIQRDELVPYVNAGKAELVYPEGYKLSWNAGDCCGQAATHHVDDVGFIKDLVASVDPGHEHPVYLVGYSNGGRLAYTLACVAPGLFDGMAVVKADPDPGTCAASRPMTVLQIAAVDDYAVPYQPGEKGQESPAATVQSAELRALDGCTGAGDAVRHGQMTLTTWTGCGNGQRYGFAVWDKGGHNFPNAGVPLKGTPDAAQIIWSFFTKSAFAPLPR